MEQKYTIVQMEFELSNQVSIILQLPINLDISSQRKVETNNVRISFKDFCILYLNRN